MTSPGERRRRIRWAPRLVALRAQHGARIWPFWRQREYGPSMEPYWPFRAYERIRKALDDA